MTEVKQQPEGQENVQPPERLKDIPAGTSVEVRQYDAIDTRKVTGNIAEDTKGAITRVMRGPGIKPIPDTVDAKQLSSEELDQRKELRLQEIYKKMYPAIRQQVDEQLQACLQENPENFAEGTKKFLQTMSIRVNLKELGVGTLNPITEFREDNTGKETEAVDRRLNFFHSLIDHGKNVISNLVGTKVERYRTREMEDQLIKKATGNENTNNFRLEIMSYITHDTGELKFKYEVTRQRR